MSTLINLNGSIMEFLGPYTIKTIVAVQKRVGYPVFIFVITGSFSEGFR